MANRPAAAVSFAGRWSRQGSIEFQQEPFRAEDDFDVFVDECVFQGREGDGPHLGEACLGGFADLGRWVAKFLDEGPGAILESGVDAMHDEEGGSHQFLGLRENVEDDCVVDGGTREMNQDDQLAWLEEGLAVLSEEKLRDVVAESLPGESPGKSVARHFRVRRVGCFHRRRHDHLHRRALDYGPFLAGILR